MNNPKTILTLTEIVEGIVEYSQTEVLDSPGAARESVQSYIEREEAELGMNAHLMKGSTMDLFQQPAGGRRGTILFSMGGHEYLFTWYNMPGEYKVTDDEFVSVLESFCNSSRSNADFQKVAETISTKMHRYCQNELWKFIKAIIRVFATARYDERNKTAHTQAGDILEFMETNNIA